MPAMWVRDETYSREVEVMWHWIQHKLGWNTGEVEAFWRDKRLMIGFRCHGCGKLLDVHESVTERREVKP
jgi:hypothetical protein